MSTDLEGHEGVAPVLGRAPHESITSMLAAARADVPGRTFLRTAQESVTYEEFGRRVDRVVAGLRRSGVRRGEPVALLMENSVDQVVIWFALARTGSLHVPVNPGLVGATLLHHLRSAAPRVVIVDAAHLSQLAPVVSGIEPAPHIVVRGASRADEALLHQCGASRFEFLQSPSVGALPQQAVVDNLDIATLLFTSGTTGLSKACALSHRYLAVQGQLHASYLGFRPDDVLYTCYPLFHIDAATLTVVAALAARCTAALGDRFSASGFWAEVRGLGATVFNFMGMTQTVLWQRPPTAQDREHSVRMAWGVPMPEFHAEWPERFGFPLLEVFGSTDAGVFSYDRIGEPHRHGCAGRVIDEYEVRVTNDAGWPQPRGTVGELEVRGRGPGLVMSAYYGLPEATAETLDQDGWLKTGDVGSVDADGYLRWVRRLSDSIRRRGENISALEVEAALCEHPDVSGCAAVGVPSELTEEELKVVLVARCGTSLDPVEVQGFCQATMPAFMVPRYIEVRSALPLTPTEKVAKSRLKGLGPDVYDAQG